MTKVIRRPASEMLTPHFSRAEFKCKCGRPFCDAKPIRVEFVVRLEALRVEWGQPLVPTSGERCEFWNKHEGGAKASRHLKGDAADFWFADPADVRAFVALAEKHRFGGIGVGKHKVHLDGRPSIARWTYD